MGPAVALGETVALGPTVALSPEAALGPTIALGPTVALPLGGQKGSPLVTYSIGSILALKYHGNIS